MKHNFLWCDVETTGLDPELSLLLEIAVILADDGPGGTCAPIDCFHAVVAVDHHAYGGSDGGSDFRARYRGLNTGHRDEDRWVDVDPYVVNMHVKNGLWEACAGPEAQDLCLVDRSLAKWLGERGAERGSVLAGNSVHFDLGFCRRHLPITANLLSHRVGDVTAMRLGFEAASGLRIQTTMPEDHRAVDDIVASLETFAEIRAAWAGWSP